VRHAEVIIALAGVLYFLFFLLHWIGNEDCWA
jgi:hypothetical protein